MAILAVSFRGLPEPVLAESLALTVDGNFHIRLVGKFEDAHGPKSELDHIRRVEWCAGATMPTGSHQLPGGMCVEPRQFAVAFDYGTPLSNKILTNGFSFHIRVAGTSPDDFRFDAFADEVLASFQRAITTWVAALADHDGLLTPAVRDFVKSRTATSSGGYVLLTPPQVVRLRCPHAATFVVELNFGGDGLFPTFPRPLLLAKGRLEGRTIALNLRDVTCFRTMPQFNAEKQLSLSDENCTNLLPVLAHELGHAFGIPHIEESDGVALMNPHLSQEALVPNQLDVRAFVAVLEKSIMGAQPGVLEFRSSEGVLPPRGWVPPSRR